MFHTKQNVIHRRVCVRLLMYVILSLCQLIFHLAENQLQNAIQFDKKDFLLFIVGKHIRIQSYRMQDPKLEHQIPNTNTQT